MSLVDAVTGPCVFCDDPEALVPTFLNCPGCGRDLEPESDAAADDDRRWLTCAFDDPPPARPRRPDPAPPTDDRRSS